MGFPDFSLFFHYFFGILFPLFAGTAIYGVVSDDTVPFMVWCLMTLSLLWTVSDDTVPFMDNVKIFNLNIDHLNVLFFWAER